MSCYVFFFNDTATTEIYTLSLHDALPILGASMSSFGGALVSSARGLEVSGSGASARATRSPSNERDRKSTRLNSSHANISYAVFCLKKKHRTLQHALPRSKIPLPRCTRR